MFLNKLEETIFKIIKNNNKLNAHNQSINSAMMERLQNIKHKITPKQQCL